MLKVVYFENISRFQDKCVNLSVGTYLLDLWVQDNTRYNKLLFFEQLCEIVYRYLWIYEYVQRR